MSGFVARRARKFLKLLRLLTNPVYRRGLRYGVSAAIEHRHVVGGMELASVVDIGANVGQFSLLVRALHPAARIVAFEPLPGSGGPLPAGFRWDGRVTLHEAAVSPEAGTATMHVSAAADSSSLLPISERQSELFPGTEEVGTTDVAVGPLDQFVNVSEVQAPAMLKIDVQGFELEVLRGSGRCFRPLTMFMSKPPSRRSTKTRRCSPMSRRFWCRRDSRGRALQCRTDRRRHADPGGLPVSPSGLIG